MDWQKWCWTQMERFGLHFTTTLHQNTLNLSEHMSVLKVWWIPFHRVVDDFVIQSGDFENEIFLNWRLVPVRGFGYCSPTFEKTDNCEDDKTDGLYPKSSRSTSYSCAPEVHAAQITQQDRNSTLLTLPERTLDGSYTVFGIAYSGEMTA